MLGYTDQRSASSFPSHRVRAMKPLDRLTNLLVMAAADGSLTEREFRFLMSRCSRWGLSEPEFCRALEYACSAQAELRIPADKEDRIAMLRDLLRMMAADGDLAETEKRLFASAAAKLELSRDELNELIDSVVGRK